MNPETLAESMFPFLAALILVTLVVRTFFGALRR